MDVGAFGKGKGKQGKGRSARGKAKEKHVNTYAHFKHM